MDKIIHINGGIGEVIAATGAVELYAKNETEKGNKVFIMTAYPGIFYEPKYITAIYNIAMLGLYKDKISKMEYIAPEPYNDYSYYLEEKHLAQVFNKLLNGKNEYVEPKLTLSKAEKEEAKKYCEELRNKTGKRIILFQPWGNTGGKFCKKPGCKLHKLGSYIEDDTYRSLELEFAKTLCSALQNDYGVILVKIPEQEGFPDCELLERDWQGKKVPYNLRRVINLIPYVDGIVCCDSFLHHASASLGSPVPTIVLWAGTNEKNLRYSNQVNIKSKNDCEYEPNRILRNFSHQYYVNKNKGCNKFEAETIEAILKALEEKKDKN